MSDGNLTFDDYRELLSEALTPVRQDISEVKETLRDMANWMRAQETRTCNAERESASNWAVNETRWRLLTWVGGALATALIGIAAAILLGGCTLPPPSQFPTPTEIDTATPSQTLPVEPIHTSIPQPQEPTSTPIPIPTQPPGVAITENLLSNSGMERFCQIAAADGSEHTVACGWEPEFCNRCLCDGVRLELPGCRPCEAGQTVGCNPVDLRMGRPEFAVARAYAFPYRARSGESQRFFCYFFPCYAGITTTIVLPENTTQCTLTAHVQVWSTGNADITRACSQLSTADDRDSWHTRLRVSYPGAGATDAISEWYDYSSGSGNGIEYLPGQFCTGHGIYDRWQEMELVFSPPVGARMATVHIEGNATWGFPNNDMYIDDIALRCEYPIHIPVIPSPTPDPDATPTRIAGDIIGCATVAAQPCANARVAWGIDYPLANPAQLGWTSACAPAGTFLTLYDFYIISDTEVWLAVHPWLGAWMRADLLDPAICPEPPGWDVWDIVEN